MKKIALFVACLLGVAIEGWSQQTTLNFDFSSVSDATGAVSGNLVGGARLEKYAGYDVLTLPSQDSYFEFGQKMTDFLRSLEGDYTISTNVFLPAGAPVEQADAQIPVWYFGTSTGESSTSFDAAPSRYAITGTDAFDITLSEAMKPGMWNSIIVFKRSGRTHLYVNGSARSVKNEVTLAPLFADAASTPVAYLGRSADEPSASATAGIKYSYFQLSNFANTNLTSLRQETNRLNAYEDSLREVRRQYEDSLALAQQMREFTLGDVSALTDDIRLPRIYNGRIKIAWETSNSNVITIDGHITRPKAGNPIAHATLTAYLSGGKAADTLYFEVGVLPEMSDAEAVEYAVGQLRKTIKTNNLYSDLTLPTTGEEGTVVVWTTSHPEWMTREGRVLQLPTADSPCPEGLKLTAIVMKNGERQQVEFPVHLHEQEPYSAYLFVYFPSNQNENIYYALSTDGYNYTPINEGERVVSSDTISLKGGVRDPHILRAPDGLFYMVCTDMRSAQGWDSNRGLVMMKSADLIHWTHSRVHFPDRYPGTAFAHVTRVWAPETIWDPDYENADGTRGRLMVYFSLLTDDGSIPYDKDYYCYANDDFTDLLGEPTFFYDRGSATIDMNIVYNESDSLYHGFYKNEGQGGICKVTARRLTPEPGQPAGSQWSAPSATLQQTTEAVEGAGVFKRINSNDWVLMYDCYNNKHYQFCSSKDLEHFTFVQNTETTGAFTPRHGTVIPITPEEVTALLTAFPTSGLRATVEGVGSSLAQHENVSISTTSITIPVVPDARLEAFDPQLVVSVGATVSPSGPQDFTKGAIDYEVTNGVNRRTYHVTAVKEGNPVLPGFHADPEVLYSKKTGRFYIYPTTDGYDGWGGHSFDVFSSADLVRFTNEGTFLDLATSEVPWATGNAWAPCIEEKLVDGKWKYYFFFSGNNSSLNKKTLGVAVAESPTGPFKASNQPLFTETSGGQMIDSDVFTDPVSGQTYFYYGNGQMHYRLLSDDMMSVEGAEYTITPTGGSLADYAYREGTYVFYRQGTYYFLWSVDDTGAANYHVAYGTSQSPTGPIKVAKDPIVIIQDPSRQIYGTGHNSVINIPGTDDWYIVYHRINRAHLNNGPGTHREVCIDRLTFNADGTISRIQPTREGIQPVDINVEDMLAGIRQPSAQREMTGVGYFTIDGRSLGTKAPTARGLYIRREQMADGSVRAMKIVKD